MKYFNVDFGRTIVVLVLFATFTNLAFGQKADALQFATSKTGAAQPEAFVAPVVFAGQNINCADLNASTDTRFSHIIDDFELKLDFSDPNGSFPFTTGAGRFVVGPQDGTKSLTVSSGSATVFSWSSQIVITAVNVKVGNTSYVYPYAPFFTRDTNLATGDNHGISHLTFCFGTAINPSAGDGSISGRVVTSYGTGISKASMTVVNAATGEASTAMTNPFGYYTIDNLKVGEFYLLYVVHKRYAFAEESRAISLNDSIADIDFVANP